MPRMWSSLLYCLDSRAVVSTQVSGLNLPIKGCIIELGGKPVYCKSDLPTMPKSTGPTWTRLSDPTCPVIKLTNSAQNSLHWLLPPIQAIPTTRFPCRPSSLALREPTPWPKGTRWASGGGSPPNTAFAWFSESYGMNEIRAQWPFMSKDAQKYILTLAQLALAVAARERHASSHLSLCLDCGRHQQALYYDFIRVLEPPSRVLIKPRR